MKVQILGYKKLIYSSMERYGVKYLVETLRYKQECRGLILDGVLGIFHWFNISGQTMALESTQLLAEMSTRNFSWEGKGGRCVGLTPLPPSCVDCQNSREPQPPGALRVFLGLYRESFTISCVP